jgi:hypothetical protein
MTELERAVEIYVIVNFLVIGLSHVLRPGVWVDFFIRLRSMGHTGVFANSFLSLSFGSIIVAFHNVWTGIPTVVTIIGWAQVTKALIGFTVPAVSVRAFNRISHDREWEFRIPGAIFLALTVLLAYGLSSQP